MNAVNRNCPILANNSHFAAIVRNSDDAIFSVSLDGVITSWNKAARILYGYHETEVIGRSISILYPEQVSELDESSNNTNLSKVPFDSHYLTERVHKNGTLLELDISISLIRNKLGNVIGFSEIARESNNPMQPNNTQILFTDHYEAIIESSDDAIISKSLDGVVVTWNKAAEHIFGYSSHEMIGQPMIKVFPRNLYDDEAIILARISNGEKINHFRTKRLTKSNKLIDVSVTISPIKDEFGNIVGASKIARDITELVKRENVAAEQAIHSNYYTAIVESSDDAIISKKLDGTVTSWNRAAENIFGYDASEIIGKPMITIFPKNRIKEEDSILKKISEGKKVDHFQTVRLHKDGHEVNVSVTISPIYDLDKNIVGASKIARDISEKVITDQKIWRLANFDSLTQLANRQHYEKKLTEELSLSKANNKQFTIMYMDLDRFKQVNDLYGHTFGDELLIQVSKRLSTFFRHTDTIARLGGDEFAAILPGISDVEAVQNLISNMQYSIRKPFKIKQHSILIGISIGTSTFPENGTTSEELIHYADLQMYQFKNQNKLLNN